MVATPSTMLALGTKAPNFILSNTLTGKSFDFSKISNSKAHLICFICNHCPYVKAIIKDIAEDCKKLENFGIKSVAICSNDQINYPEDSFENMIIFGKKHNFSFPYLIDDTQNVAKKYEAVCTPDFFGYNENLELQYRGRIRELKELKPVRSGESDLYIAIFNWLLLKNEYNEFFKPIPEIRIAEAEIIERK